jgi:hypothetical protein
MPVLDRWSTTRRGPSAKTQQLSHCTTLPSMVQFGLRAGEALSTMGPWTGLGIGGHWDGAEEASNPQTLAIQADKEIVAAVKRAGGQVERTASGHLKVIGPAGSAIVASAPNTGRAGGRAVHNTLATIKSKTGVEV